MDGSGLIAASSLALTSLRPRDSPATPSTLALRRHRPMAEPCTEFSLSTKTTNPQPTRQPNPGETNCRRSALRRPASTHLRPHTVTSARHTSHTGRGERHSAARVALVAGMRPRSALHAACSNRARGDCRVERLCCGTARLLSPDRPMRCRRHRLRSAAASAPRSDRRPGTRRRPRRADR